MRINEQFFNNNKIYSSGLSTKLFVFTLQSKSLPPTEMGSRVAFTLLSHIIHLSMTFDHHQEEHKAACNKETQKKTLYSLGLWAENICYCRKSEKTLVIRKISVKTLRLGAPSLALAQYFWMQCHPETLIPGDKGTFWIRICLYSSHHGLSFGITLQHVFCQHVLSVKLFFIHFIRHCKEYKLRLNS